MQTLGLAPSFWRNRRVFVTGHTGFMGGWLSLWLDLLGARVSGYALSPPTRPALFEAAGVVGAVDSTIADITDARRLAASMADARPEVVLHLAAQPLVRHAHAAPVETFAVNVMGTAHVMEALRRVDGVLAAVIVTTDKVYDNREWSWGYRENDPLGAHEPYGASKACAELVVESYRRSYFADRGRAPGIATVRAGNIIGGGDWAADRLVPDAVSAFAGGRPLVVRRPDAVRPWQHVLAPVHGMLALAERLADAPERWSEAWNFGPAPDDAITVADLAGRLAALWGDGAAWRAMPSDGPSDGPMESTLLSLDSSKARVRLAWRGRWGLERTLAETVGWYKAHIEGCDMRAVCHRQIGAYAGAN